MAAAAREAGKVRFLGFTGHKKPAYVRGRGAARVRKFDAVQMPLNIMDPHFESFEREVIPVAQKTDTRTMKSFGDRRILETHIATPLQMLHYSMN